MKKRKTQKRGSAEQVNRPVNFNLNDPEERLDYEYTLKWLNFSGSVKRWIRSERLSLPRGDVLEVSPMSLLGVELFESHMTEEEAFNSMF